MFATIFDRHYDAVHRYLARRVGADLADDLAAEAFTRAFDFRARFDLRARTPDRGCSGSRRTSFAIITGAMRGGCAHMPASTGQALRNGASDESLITFDGRLVMAMRQT